MEDGDIYIYYRILKKLSINIMSEWWINHPSNHFHLDPKWNCFTLYIGFV